MDILASVLLVDDIFVVVIGVDGALVLCCFEVIASLVLEDVFVNCEVDDKSEVV